MFERIGFPIIISGPSAVGKGTVVDRLVERNPEFKLSVSVTTRPKRPNEIEGKSYFFVSDEEFQSLIQRDKLLEYAKVHGHYYGTPCDFVEEAICEGNNVILEIDVQGATSLINKIQNGVFIFLLPPTMEALKERIEARGVNGQEDMENRIEIGKQEIDILEEYDYVVINSDVDKAIEDIETILKAEALKVERNKGIGKYLKNGGKL
ncbi:MAG: guanylate kinase [Christensenellales bacterium]|jgi:guanylate kinase